VLKKVLATLLELFGARGIVPWPLRYAPGSMGRDRDKLVGGAIEVSQTGTCKYPGGSHDLLFLNSRNVEKRTL